MPPPVSADQWVIALFTAAIFTGLYLSTLIYCLRWLLFTDEGWKLRKKIDWTMLVAALSLFALSSTHLSLALRNTIINVLEINQSSATSDPDPRLPWANAVMCTVANLSILIADAILIYRCWLACLRSRKSIVFPSIFWVGGVVCTIIQLYWQVIQSAAVANAWQPVNMTIGPGTVLTPFWGSTIVVNVYATSLIVYRIWRAEKASKLITSTRDLRFSMRVLIESGALYLTVAIPHFAVWWTTNSAAIVVLSWMNLPVVCSAFNLILIRTSRQRVKGEMMGIRGDVSGMEFSIPTCSETSTVKIIEIKLEDP